MARPVSPRDGAGPLRSPSPQPLSKRDKRRQMLSEKLSDMVASFATNHFDHYYAQLAAIQCDINLVLRADPYRTAPLPDTSEEINKAVTEAREEVTRRGQISEEAEASFSALSGRHYAKFVEDINLAIEERDRDLTMLYNEHHDRQDELRRTNQYKIQLAHEEHALLSKTLRERLIQSVTQKKAKLLRDKEQLDIADSNALLLNPTQFSIGNPSSPGGAKSNRQTRHTRGRPGEVANAAADENGAAPTLPQDSTTNGNKRKRKDDDNDSPGPSSRALDMNGASTPQHNSRTKQYQSQFEAPLYSIDRLFTEKELAMNMNRAHIATNDFFARLRAQGVENRLQAAAANGVGSTANGSTENGDDAAQTTEGAAAESSAPPSPTQAAAPLHATRAAQRLNPQPDLTSAAAASGLLPSSLNPASLPSAYTVTVPTGSSKAIPAAPSPASLPEVDVSSDWALMHRQVDDPILKTLAEKCLEKRGVVDLPAATAAGVLGQGPAAPGVDGLSALAMAQGDAATLRMGRGASAIGASSMSRVASERGWGGEAMSRSVSAADFGAGGRRR